MIRNLRAGTLSRIQGMRKMPYPIIALFMSAAVGFAGAYDGSAMPIRVNEDGVYYAGFMCWYATQTPFLLPPDLVVLGVVEDLTKPPAPRQADATRIRLRVDDVVVCPDSLIESVATIRYLETVAPVDAAVGDSILVFLTPYEGAFAIPSWTGTNTAIGHRLDRSEPLCDEDAFLALLRSGRAWNLERLSGEELRLWRCVDSDGLLEALLRDRESTSPRRPIR